MEDEELDGIRGAFVAELRRLAPDLRGWWQAKVADAGEAAMNLRWPTGLAGHPRVIAAFRDAYLEITDLNDDRLDGWEDRFAVPDPLDEAAWGVEPEEEGPRFVRHIDALVMDLRELAPDVFDLVQGMVFVPLGIDDEDEVV